MSEIKSIIRLIILFVVIIAIITICFIKACSPKYPEVDHWEKYVVQPGDSLWSITPENSKFDKRAIISLVKEHNNIDNMIIANTVIELPVW